jgi:hypothetical protein
MFEIILSLVKAQVMIADVQARLMSRLKSPNPRMKSDRCLRSEVDSARGRAVMGWVWLLARVAAAAYAERWVARREY